MNYLADLAFACVRPRAQSAAAQAPGPLPAAVAAIAAAQPPDESPAERTLAVAAALAVRERAGMCTRAIEVTGTDEAPPDERSPSSAAAAATLAELLEHEVELIPEWLACADSRGVRPPDDLLPKLLATALSYRTAQPAVTATIIAALGPRGRWLASQRADWRQLAPALPTDDWEHAGLTHRLVLLQTAEPARAAELVREAWGSTPADGRLAMLRYADEELLEQALDDRGSTVRTAAAAALAARPDSAYAARMAERLRECVRVERRGFRRVMVPVLPERDEGLTRDCPAAASAGRQHGGLRAALLAEVLAAAPLGAWHRLTGHDNPADIMALPVEDDRKLLVHKAIRVAVVRQRDGRWASALVRDAVDPELLRLAEPAAQARAVTAAFADPKNLPVGLLENYPLPWPEPVIDALMSWLERTIPAYVSALHRPLAAGLSSADNARLLALVARDPHSPNAQPLSRLAHTLALRQRMHEEFA